MRNELFVTAGEVAQELGVSKPFAYKLVRQMNEELEEKGFITIAGRVSRKYYEEKFYGMAQAGVRTRSHTLAEVVKCMCKHICLARRLQKIRRADYGGI